MIRNWRPRESWRWPGSRSTEATCGTPPATSPGRWHWPRSISRCWRPSPSSPPTTAQPLSTCSPCPQRVPGYGGRAGLRAGTVGAHRRGAGNTLPRKRIRHDRGLGACAVARRAGRGAGGRTRRPAAVAVPPDPGEGRNTHPSWWTRGVQAWACLGLVHHRTDEPWHTSTRRRILWDLVFGPEDWVTEAALFALVVGAWVDPALRHDVAGIVADRLDLLARAWRRRPVTIIAKVARLALVTPDLDAKARSLAAEIDAAEQPRI